MKIKPELHRLLILSQDFEVYKRLIEQKRLPGLSIMAVNEPSEAIRIGSECELVFG